jgi:hypothetical protein
MLSEDSTLLRAGNARLVAIITAGKKGTGDLRCHQVVGLDASWSDENLEEENQAGYRISISMGFGQPSLAR